MSLVTACVVEHGSEENAPVPDDFFAAEAIDAAVARAENAAEQLAPSEPEEPEEQADEPELGPLLGSFDFTYYWVANQKKAHGDSAQATVQLYQRKGCVPLAKVSPAFADRLELEGTGRLNDGRVLNTSGPCSCGERNCFYEVPRSARFGVGVGKRPLSPFRSVAVDSRVIPIGTVLYIPELDGLTMPGRAPYGGFVHDGCVIADDRGGGVKGHQLDFFTARRTYYTSFNRRHRLKRVTVYDGKGRCTKVGRKLVAVDRNSI